MSALLLKHQELGKGHVFGAIERVINVGTTLYVRSVRGLVACAGRSWLFLGLLGLTYVVIRASAGVRARGGRGYFISIVQAPAGASLEYTTNVMKQAEQV